MLEVTKYLFLISTFLFFEMVFLKTVQQHHKLEVINTKFVGCVYYLSREHNFNNKNKTANQTTETFQ